MKFISTIINKLSNSHFYKIIKKFFGNLKTENSAINNASSTVKDFVDNSPKSKPIDFGAYIAERVNKFLKKFNKKFKNEEKAKGTISKMINGFLKVICTIAAIIFGAIVIYAFIKILPTIIMITAVTLAALIAIELIMSVLNTAVE